jgi:hypothetical protein
MSMFMLSFIVAILCGLEWKRNCADVLLFVYICIAVGDPVITTGGLEILSTGLTLACSMPGPGLFKRHMPW